MGTKRILFPLEMRNGNKVHTLEELKENFDIEKTLRYADNGQLVRWLRDRNSNDIAEKIELIESLDHASEEYTRRVCEAILGEMNGEILEQIEEVIEKKEKVEKEAKEQIRIEEVRKEEKKEIERKKEEQRKKQPPTLFVNDEAIFVVEGNRLIPCCGDFSIIQGIVQDGKDIYYLDNKCILCRVNSETKEKIRLNKMDFNIFLYGVKNHKLFYMGWPQYKKQYFEIFEMDLTTGQTKVHKFESKMVPLISEANNIGILGGLEYCRRDYPYFEQYGKHMYCRMRDNGYGGNIHVADINLEEDKVSEFFSLKIPMVWEAEHWGTGISDFIVRDYHTVRKRKVRCVYYNIETNQMYQIPQSGGEIPLPERSKEGMISHLCCGEERIYCLVDVRRGEYNTMILNEYDISSGNSVERMCIRTAGYFYPGNYRVDEILVNNHYLYMNGTKDITKKGRKNETQKIKASWRFSLDNWKPEKLVKDDSEYGYIAYEYIAEEIPADGILRI